MTPQERSKLLSRLAQDECYESVDDLIEAAALDSVICGICTDPDCGHTTDNIEPDQDQGWCEACGKNSVQSALIIAGMI